MEMSKQTKRLQQNFMQKMKEDPAMRQRFEAGYEEAKSGIGTTLTFEEMERATQAGGVEHGRK